MELAGKRAIVFGGTSGINLGIAKMMAARGADVFVVSRSEEKVAAAIAAIGGSGRTVGGCSADVRDYAAVEAAVECAAVSGPIDIVVSGAAGNFLAPAAEMSANAFRTVIEIDLLGTFNTARACHPHFCAQDASFLAISAPQAIKPMLGQAHACAAKAGINMLVRCLALEWGPQGIRVNAISPGPIAGTEGMRRLAPTDESSRSLAGSLPLRRYGTIDEIAEAACFLASARGSYITGAVLDVDGGTALGSGGLV